MIGQPMTAEGFDALAAHFTNRTVVTYDPRGLGRSVRTDGRSDHTPQQQAADLHLLIEALGAGPVDVFAYATRSTLHHLPSTTSRARVRH
jgi:pimeloyl-ACP methyl ester carboxylesterase